MKTEFRVLFYARFALLMAVSVLFFGCENAPEKEEQVYTVVERMPIYPGGDKALFHDLKSNLKYPVEAQEQDIEGRVYVSFIIDKEGNMKDTKVEKGIGGGCDEEALRAVKSLQSWTPALQGGKPVNFKYFLPIKFRLIDDEAPADSLANSGSEADTLEMAGE